MTYARCGTVISANSRPLEMDDLDDQGRCVMTDHGYFVLFNVYVPCGSGGDALPRKMRFLHALENAMAKQRRVRGRRVILVGDMNVKLDRKDVHWEDRRVNIDEVLERHESRRRRRRRGGGEDGTHGTANDDDDDDASRTWMDDVARHWERIATSLSTIEAVPRRTTNPSTGANFDRFRARVAVASPSSLSNNNNNNNVDDPKYAMLGDYEDTAEDATLRYNLDELRYVDPLTGMDVVYCRRNSVSVRTLSELMAKVGGVCWDENVRRDVSNSDMAGLNPDSPPLVWMKRLMDGEYGMVDVFRHLYPNAEAR